MRWWRTPVARRTLAVAAGAVVLVVAVALLVTPRLGDDGPGDDDRGGADGAGGAGSAPAPGGSGAVTRWVYQLQGYRDGRLDAIAAERAEIAVIDLARDAKSDLFTAEEIASVRRAGTRVLGYFEIGSIEDFRPEYPVLRSRAGDLIANRWDEWPEERFVRYWDERWWELVVRPRLDLALGAGFDGVYLDTPLAYEQLDLDAAGGRDRAALAAAMVDLIVRISRYAKQRRPDFLIFPQNSPELRRLPGYTAAIDGIGMEELFFLATDRRCDRDWCAENLAEARALRAAGKVVLAVDYATRREHRSAACASYRAEGFAGYVTVRELNRITTPCG